MIGDGKILFEKFFTVINVAALNHKIDKMQIKLNDELFRFISAKEFKNVGNSILKNLTIIITHPAQIIYNEDEQLAIIKRYHDNFIEGGHCGQKRLYAKIRSKYYWKNMSKMVSVYVRKCNQCQMDKIKKHTREELTMTKTPQKPFDIVTIDTIGPLEMSEQGNKYAVTLICNLSKYLISVAIPNKEAKTVAKAIFNNFIMIY